MGLVSQVFDETALRSLDGGHLAIGHARYSTTGSSTWENAQPTLGDTAGGTVALAHNGNLTNSAEPEGAWWPSATAPRSPASLRRGNTTDTALVTTLLTGDPDHSLEATALEVLPLLRGAFSLVFMDEHTLYAARDAHGVRPLVLGRLERGWVVASETSALATIGASVIREVEPGEPGGHRRRRTAHPPVRAARAQGLRVRVRLPGPARHHDRRSKRARGAGRDGPRAWPASTPSRPTW
nr:hypothetical protein [Angustibacter aerolatus]